MTAFHVVLFEPEIPPNTGNIIRLCANTGSELHLIHPLGFQISDKHLRRAGLDYHDLTLLHEYSDFDDFLERFGGERLYAIETCGEKMYSQASFVLGDAFLFGTESRGLPQAILSRIPRDRVLRIPMRENIRSLNLSNSAAVIVYEAWRQCGFT